MASNFYKSKQNRILNVKKRFQFDPKSQPNRARANPKQKLIQMIIKDQNGEYSSVKEHNDFNDSSWLAKLVNGLEDCDNISGKPLSDINNLFSIASSQINKKLENLQNNFTVQMNNPKEKLPMMSRKSMPSMPSYRGRKQSKQNTKLNCQTQIHSQTQNQNKYESSDCTKSMNSNLSKNATIITKDHPIKQKKSYFINSKNSSQNQSRAQSQQNRHRSISATSRQSINQFQNSKHQKQAHKNSLINYSSIKQQENETPQLSAKKQQNEAIIIDLDQISLLKTEQHSREATPVQSKAKSKIRDQINKISAKKNRQKLTKKDNKNCESKQNQYYKPKVSKTQKSTISINAQSKINVSNKQNCSQNTGLQNTAVLKENEKSKLSNNKEKKDNVNKVVIGQINKLQNHQEHYTVKQNYKNSTNQALVPFKLQNKTEKHEIQVLSSHNQFLDTFKQQMPIINSIFVESQNQNSLKKEITKNQLQQKNIIIPSKSTKVGSIKKNLFKNNENQNAIKQKIAKLQIKQLSIANLGTSEEDSRIPTFSQRPTETQGDVSKQATITDRNIQRQNSLKKLYNESLRYQQNMRKRSFDGVKQTVSTIKKGIEPTRLSFQSVLQNQVIQSPKFNYYKPGLLKNNFFYSNLPSQMLQKKLAYQQVFKKLNINKQIKIHKYNCNENMLDGQQKYQCGAILSKIKYLDHIYTQKQFIDQCLKMEGFQSQDKKFSNKHQTDRIHRINQNKITQNLKFMNQTNKIKTNERKRVIDENNENVYQGNTMSQTKLQKIKHQISKQKSYTQEKHKNHQSYKQNMYNYEIQRQFTPLFPQTISTYTQRTESVGKGFSNFKNQNSKGKQGDIGSILQNLNNKLSNYIQTNNLQDTYRKFKLQFVQLRRNMPY